MPPSTPLPDQPGILKELSEFQARQAIKKIEPILPLTSKRA